MSSGEGLSCSLPLPAVRGGCGAVDDAGRSNALPSSKPEGADDADDARTVCGDDRAASLGIGSDDAAGLAWNVGPAYACFAGVEV